jgi:glucosylceramidase
VSEIVIDATGSGGDFPRGYELFVSSDGVNWGEPIARGGGRSKLAVQFPAVSARYLRVVNQGSAGNWWSIHELTVGAPGTGAAAPAGSTSGLQQKTATLSDGTKLLAIYNAGTKLATFDRQLGTSTWTYKLPATAVAIFTERATG